LDGLRPTELAAQLQITKQSINDLVSHLEQRGYLVRKPDPIDGRARVVRLTAKGRRLEQTINAQAQNAELRIAEMLGPRPFAALRDALEELSSLLTRHDGPSATTA
jgi:DNA-binding MarR family transcriptional regulator